MRERLKIFAALALLAISFQALAQKPIIRSVTKTSGTALEQIEVLGSGFSDNPAQLIVYFGSARGTITYASEGQIKATVPPGATFENIRVVNLASGLSGSSDEAFLLSFGGNDFDPARFENHDLYPGEPTSSGMLDFCLCDLDSDGKLDWVAGNDYGRGVYIMQNTSASENISSVYKLINLSTSITHLACKDMNNDGKPDIVATRGGQVSDRLLVLPNTSTGPGSFTFGSAIILQVPAAINLSKVKIKDLDNDGLPDIIVTDQTNQNAGNVNNVVHIFKNTTSGAAMTFDTSPFTLRIEDKADVDGDEEFLGGAYGIDVEDLNNDDYPEIMITPQFGQNICIFENSSIPGTLSFTNQYILKVSSPLYEVRAADINNDERPDILVTKVDELKRNIEVFINTTSANEPLSFGPLTSLSLAKRPWSLDLGDVNGDGKVDIVYSSISDNLGFGILINNGGGSLDFTEHLINASAKQRPVRVGDVNGDGRPDISLGTAENMMSVFINKNCVFPETTPAGSVDICAGLGVRLKTHKGIGLEYEWTRDGLEIPDIQDALETEDPGEYRVTIASDNGACSETSEAVTLNLNPGSTPQQPSITSDASVCLGDNLTLSAESSTPNVQFHWEGPNDWQSTETSPVVPDVTENQEGYYMVQVENAAGCRSEKDTLLISVLKLPKIAVVGPDGFCSGTEAELSVAWFDDHSYQWKKNGANISGATTAELAVDEVGTYSAVITKDGCSSESPAFELESLALPQADFDVKAKACVDEAVSFTNTSTIPLPRTVEYNWSFGDGKFSTATNPSHAYGSDGEYDVRLTVAYRNTTCESSTEKSISIEFAEPPVLSASDTVFCPGDSVLLDTEGSYANYSWSNGGATKSIYAADSGTYTLTATTATGCSASGSITITVYPRQELTIATESGDSLVSIGKSLQLLADDHFDHYQWEPVSGLSDPAAHNPSASPRATTTYTLTATDENGCLTSTSYTVYIDGSAIKLKAPKAFSPNGDAVNDYWEIEDVLSFEDSEIAIFDGQGQKVYEASPYKNDWDARMNGKLLPEGVYYFVLKFRETNSVQTGSILVVR